VKAQPLLTSENENYSLMKLEEVENHIKNHKHLPGIPSAEEVKQNGVNLGKNQVQLLQKIEELTLYVIAQDKKIKELESKIKTKRGKK